MNMDYGFIRNQIVSLANRYKRLELSSIYQKICDKYREPRYDVIIETLIRITADARKVARMLVEGLYSDTLCESMSVFKRNGVSATEIAKLSNPYILNNDKLISVLLQAGADPNLIIERAEGEMIQRHLESLIKAGADGNLIAERITSLDKNNAAYVIQTLRDAGADINILLDNLENKDEINLDVLYDEAV